MIPVTPKPEPADFDSRVRKRGLSYLKENGFSLSQPLPPKADIYPYWRNCLTDLHQAYGGICAYIGVYFERVMGGGSVDHFIAQKSADAGMAYEWSNYRLACTTMNSRKREYSNVLDPFLLKPDWFWLELTTGHIYPSSQLKPDEEKSVKETIERLGLDDALCRDLRSRWYQDYCQNNISEEYLKDKSPFIWHEANRQMLL